MKEGNIANEARCATWLSQEQFSKMYQIPLSTVRKHEQQVSGPPGATTAYYKLIKAFPGEIKKMLESLSG